MSKRRRSIAFADSELISIKYADSNDAIQAEAALVKLLSAVARGLPSDAQEWDVSSLRSEVDGRPFSREVVVAWLNAAYQTVYAVDFDNQPEHPASSVSCIQLCHVLLFADAVFSTVRVIDACVAGITDVILEAGLGQQQVQLHTSSSYIFCQQGLQLCEMVKACATRVQNACSNAEKEQFVQQLAEQTEQLMYTAYKAQSGALIRHLHKFICMNNCFAASLLRQHTGTVFSERVLVSALGPNIEGSELWMQAVTSGSSAGPLLSLPGVRGILEPLQLDGERHLQPIKFKAKINQDYLGYPAGSVVAVEFDLVSSVISLGAAKICVQIHHRRCSP